MTLNFDKPIDVSVFDHGSLIGICPNTDHAETWIGEYVDPNAQWHGKRVMVEPRYAATLLNAMQEDGLSLEGL